MTIFLDSFKTIELIETGSTDVVNYQDGTEYCETICFADIYLDKNKPACSYFLTTNLGFSYALQIPGKYLEKLNHLASI
jgi:hypothetical protein